MQSSAEAGGPAEALALPPSPLALSGSELRSYSERHWGIGDPHAKPAPVRPSSLSAWVLCVPCQGEFPGQSSAPAGTAQTGPEQQHACHGSEVMLTYGERFLLFLMFGPDGHTGLHLFSSGSFVGRHSVQSHSSGTSTERGSPPSAQRHRIPAPVLREGWRSRACLSAGEGAVFPGCVLGGGGGEL